MSVVYSSACIKYSGNYAEMESKNGHPQQQQQKRYHHHKNSGLSRYRSAPSSLLTDLVEDSRGCVNEIEEASRGLDHHHHHHHHHQQQQQQQNRYVPCLGSEMEAMLAKLLSSSSSSSSNNGWNNVKQEGEAGGSVFSHDRPDHLIYNSHEFQGFPNGSSCSSSSSSVMMSNNTMALENSVQSKMGSGNCSNLLMRQKSHPPGFLSNFSVRNGFVALGEQATTSTCGLNGTLTFSSGPSSCSGRMPQIAENGNETIEEEATTCVPSSRNLRNDNGSHRSHNVPSFTSDFWENSAFTAPKPVSTDNDEFVFSVSNAFESQHADGGYHNLGLSHQLSLPSSSTKIASKERFLKIQGSVPCKIRAKRGFATHPRSIAERIRRTRISERIKKLQELFPKSDKQTSTADMLDLAVDYIKNLQEQVKVLTDTRAMCTCSSSQKQCSRPCA